MSKNEEPVELQPIAWLDSDPDLEENLYDFRPTQIYGDDAEELVAPKDSPVQESVDSSRELHPAGKGTTVPVVKDSGKTEENESSTPAS